MEEETTVKSLLETIKQQNQQLLENKEAKPWKLPWKAKVSNARVKKGWAHVQIIRNNGEQEFIKARIDNDGCVDIDGFPRIATAEHRMTYKNRPYYIFPEWSMRPISLTQQMEKDVQDKMDVFGRRTVLARIVSKEMKPGAKKSIGMIGWIILAAIVIGAIYYITKGGGKLF